MNRYIALLERAVAKLPPGSLTERQGVYERARNAIYETFAGPANADARAEEFRLLEEAIEDIELRFVAGRLPIVDAIAPLPSGLSAPPAEETAGKTAAPPAAPPPQPAAPPGGTLFAQGRMPVRSAPTRDEEEDAGALSMRLRMLGLLVAAGFAGAFLLARPDFLQSPRAPALAPSQQAAPARNPVIRLQDLQWTASGGHKGVVSWTMEVDQSSFAPRRSPRHILVGRADLRPLAPPVRMFFVPAEQDGYRATHFLEFRFDEDDRFGVAAVQSLRIATGQQELVEPEGVIIRTAGYGHAFVFSNVPKDAVINDALFSQAEELVVSLRLENGASPTIVLQTVKLKADAR